MRPSKFKKTVFLKKGTVSVYFSKPIKVLAVLIIIILLFTLSEVLYMVNNNPSYLVNYYLNKAYNASQKNDAQKAISYLFNASSVYIKYQAKNYPSLIPKNYSPRDILSRNTSGLEQAYLSRLLSSDSDFLIKGESNQVAKIFYELGVLAYKEGEQGMVIPLFQTAVYLDPELSHYHVELANYYLLKGNIKESEDTLEFCSKFRFSNEHCQQYLDNNFFWKVPEEVGFLENSIKEHYENN